MQNKGLLVGIGALVLVALVAGGYFLLGKNNSSVLTPQTQQGTVRPVPTTSTSTDSGTTADEEVQEIQVEGKEFSFTPSSLSVEAEKKVRIVFKNMGKFPHNFSIKELNLKTKTISPGQTDTLEFTPEEAGTLTFYCSVGNHQSQGMEGKITVE